MSYSHRGFEILESRCLLSSIGLVNGNLSTIRAAAAETQTDTREQPALETEEQVSKPLAPEIVESNDTPNFPQTRPPDTTQEPAIESDISESIASRNEIEKPLSENPLSENPAANETEDTTIKTIVKVAVVEEVESVAIEVLTADVVVVKEPVAVVAANDVASIRSSTTTTDDSTSTVQSSTFQSQNEVNTKTTSTRVTVANVNTAVRATNNQLSMDEKEQTSFSETDAAANVQEEDKPDSGNREDADESGTDTTDRQQPSREETPVRDDVATGNSATGDERSADTSEAISAVARKQNDTELTSNTRESIEDIEAKLHRQDTSKDEQPVVARSNAASNTDSTDLSRQNARHSGKTDPSTTATDRVFSEEQSESDRHQASSGMLPQAEGALLLVALGKPLTRLVVGDSRVDAANLDSGSPALRTTVDRTRRNRRKTADERDRWHRRGDARNTTWLPPEELPLEVLPVTLEEDETKAPSSRQAAKSLPPKLADEIIFSRMDMDDDDDSGRDDRSQPQQSPYVWDGYALLGGAAVVTLSGTISVLAADRHLRVRSQDRRISPPPPTYTGRTLARV